MMRWPRPCSGDISFSSASLGRTGGRTEISYYIGTMWSPSLILNVALKDRAGYLQCQGLTGGRGPGPSGSHSRCCPKTTEESDPSGMSCEPGQPPWPHFLRVWCRRRPFRIGGSQASHNDKLPKWKSAGEPPPQVKVSGTKPEDQSSNPKVQRENQHL